MLSANPIWYESAGRLAYCIWWCSRWSRSTGWSLCLQILQDADEISCNSIIVCLCWLRTCEPLRGNAYWKCRHVQREHKFTWIYKSLCLQPYIWGMYKQIAVYWHNELYIWLGDGLIHFSRKKITLLSINTTKLFSATLFSSRVVSSLRTFPWWISICREAG